MKNEQLGYLTLALLGMVIFTIISVGPAFMHLDKSYQDKTIIHTSNETMSITNNLTAELLKHNKSNSLRPDTVSIIIKDSSTNSSITQTYVPNKQTPVFFGERKVEVTYIITTDSKTFVKYSYPKSYSLKGLNLFIYNNIFYIFLVISLVTCIYLLFTALQLLYFG